MVSLETNVWSAAVQGLPVGNVLSGMRWAQGLSLSHECSHRPGSRLTRQCLSFQSRSRGDGDHWLEVHGSLAPPPGG